MISSASTEAAHRARTTHITVRLHARKNPEQNQLPPNNLSRSGVSKVSQSITFKVIQP
jgi:hypothetical protein